MNFNHQYGRPINGQAPYFPFGGASLPPWPLMGAPGAPPPFFMPPPVPPIDFRMLPNPLNPLLVYQTNNYYSPNVSSSSCPQTVNPYFQKIMADAAHPKTTSDGLKQAEQVKPKPLRNSLPTQKVAEIIQIQSSEQADPIQPEDKIVPKLKQPRKQRTVSRLPVKVNKKKYQGKKDRYLAGADLFQQNLKSTLGEPRRSQRQLALKPPNYQFLQSDSPLDREQMKQPLMLQTKHTGKHKLIFKFDMTQPERTHICLSKLRELKPQIMIGKLYQANTSLSSHFLMTKSRLSELRQSLSTRIFH